MPQKGHEVYEITSSDDDPPKKPERSRTEPITSHAVYNPPAPKPQDTKKLKSDRFTKHKKLLDTTTVENYRKGSYTKDQQDFESSRRLEDDWFSVKFQTYIKYSRWERKPFGGMLRWSTELIGSPVLIGKSPSSRQKSRSY